MRPSTIDLALALGIVWSAAALACTTAPHLTLDPLLALLGLLP